MPTISDKKIASIVTSFQSQLSSNPSAKLGEQQALDILAQVGDRSGWSASKVATELKKPGMTLDAKIELAKKGLSASEKKDLATIVSTVPLEANAKALLEGVLGTTPAPQPPTTTGLSVTGDQTNGLAGVTKAGATIEAINLSASPTGRYHTDDTFTIGKADATGHFSGAKLSGDMTMKEGDVIRLRARYADGTTSDWMDVKANTAETKDTRNAEVALFRIGLKPSASGGVDVENINEGRQISEPNAKLQFTNVRTGEKQVITLDKDGTFPKGVKLKGQGGDSFSVAASDGVNNTAFTTSVGNVTVSGGTVGGDIIKDPALHKDEMNADGTPKYGKKNFTGPLFVDGAKFDDVQQGQLGDCYFPSAIASIANVRPEIFKDVIKSNGDGTYTVTFKDHDWSSGKDKDVQIKVDGDLYVRSYGGPLYGSSKGSTDPKTMEMWFPLLEKAYAQWKGSYNAIGNGGASNDVFEAIMGGTGSQISTNSGDDRVWSTIKKALDAKKPVSAGTHDDGGPVNYANTGVYGDHSYSVLGYEETNGTKYVTLRNPWGESEPAGNGANDGVFKLSLADFRKLYDNVMYLN